jgi:UDP-N-acetylglucosamine--N-acetylmuramyl-(pentapeptide) pyrophosphoryl-undecaprenol N-acetylglucosamine transferase
MAPKIDEVAVGFKETKERLNRGNIVITGNPNKMSLNTLTKSEAKKKVDISGKMLLIFGGSQGAYKINETILSIINSGEFGNYTVIYATGPKHFDEVSDRVLNYDQTFYEIEKGDDEVVLYRKSQDVSPSFTFSKASDGVEKDIHTIEGSNVEINNPIIIKKFIYNMEEIMKAADLVMCRSGALTCTEITEVGVPAILIPFPYAAENHQYFNALTIQDARCGYYHRGKRPKCKTCFRRNK